MAEFREMVRELVAQAVESGGWSVNALAREVGCKQPHLCNFYRGRDGGFSIESCERVLSFFECTLTLGDPRPDRISRKKYEDNGT